ncbi:MAG: hypothetical protein R2838_06995 [Caldilineaceae bacterium]
MLQSRLSVTHYDFVMPYVRDLANVVDIAAIRSAGSRSGPIPWAAQRVWAIWAPIDLYGLDIQVVNLRVDPTFAFMTVDKDGKIRMDCSSPYAMASLIDLRDQFGHRLRQRPGLRPPRHRHLQRPRTPITTWPAINYLFRHRPAWSDRAAVGKTFLWSPAP